MLVDEQDSVESQPMIRVSVNLAKRMWNLMLILRFFCLWRKTEIPNANLNENVDQCLFFGLLLLSELRLCNLLWNRWCGWCFDEDNFVMLLTAQSIGWNWLVEFFFFLWWRHVNINMLLNQCILHWSWLRWLEIWYQRCSCWRNWSKSTGWCYNANRDGH